MIYTKKNKGLLISIIVLVLIYIILCYLDTSREGFYNTDTNNRNMEVRDILAVDTLFPGHEYTISLSKEPVVYYNNLDTAITLRCVIFDAPPILENVIVTFHDIKSQKPDVKWLSSKWLMDKNIPFDESKNTRTFELKQYLEPDTTYRIHIQTGYDGKRLTGPGLESPVKLGKQIFRALGVEVQPVDSTTDTTHGGPLDGNMGLALIHTTTSSNGNTETQIIPGGEGIQLGQVDMIPYNQCQFNIRVPDIRVFHELIKRHITKLSGDLGIEETYTIMAGINEYTPWKFNASVVELTKDGSRPLTEEELEKRDRNNRYPRVRVETSNPSICITNSNPTGPCMINVIGVLPGIHYRVTVDLVFNQLDTTNNYRRTLPLSFQFQAIDITGSASLLNPTRLSQQGLADTIVDMGKQLDIFKNRQKTQDVELDELEDRLDSVQFVQK